MDAAALARHIEHTLLSPDATSARIERLCDEALEHGFHAVCVNGRHVARCARRVGESGVRVAAVIGFPLGGMASAAKASEARIALEDGAHELDMVLPVGALIEGEEALVLDDIAAVVDAARSLDARVKVILETCLLDHDRKLLGCELVRRAGADFVKTSTGFAQAGATVADVRLLRACVGDALGVKAAGGIRTRADALSMLEAGADRLGASASVAIVRG